MKILIETIPHSAQRYETVGDWVKEPSGWYEGPVDFTIKVSELGHEQMEALVAIHELVEFFLCEFAYPRVTQKTVDDFDNLFLQWQDAGIRSKDAEAGDDERAPYTRQHCMATAVERMLAAYIGVPWDVYEAVINGTRKTSDVSIAPAPRG